MMPIEISVRADVKKIARDLDRLAYQQLPFATAQALTGLAWRVHEAETEALESVFDRPVSLTKRAFGVIAARKATLTATVFAKDIQAKYLGPSEFDEPQYLGAGKKIRTPVDIATNSSGNIPRGKIQTLLARPDVFMGTVKGVNGLWQRPSKGMVQGRRRITRKGAKAPVGQLVLLVAFTNPKEVKTKLGYRDRAQGVIDAFFAQEFAMAMDKALATAKE